MMALYMYRMPEVFNVISVERLVKSMREGGFHHDAAMYQASAASLKAKCEVVVGRVWFSVLPAANSDFLGEVVAMPEIHHD